MDENGIPIIGAGLDYTTVEPLNQRQLVSFLNTFFVRTAAFMNNFTTQCENKLESLDSRLKKMDTALTLLEAKLNSIDLLKDININDIPQNTAPVAQTQSQTVTSTPAPPSASGGPPAPPPPPPPGFFNSGGPPPPPPPPPPPGGFFGGPPPPPPLPTSGFSNPPPPPPPPPPGGFGNPPAAIPPPPPPPVENTVSKDPRFEKFFKMIKMGVPEQAVRIKMTAEGLNPDLISTPDAPAPPAPPKKDADSDQSDDSDSD